MHTGCDNKRFATAIQACIDAHRMLFSGAQVLVAVSGGPDSMALLSILHHLSAAYNITLLVAHVNHLLRGLESHRDATFVRQQAERLSLPYYQTEVDVKTYQRIAGLSPQHAARQLRYRALRTMQETLKATHIALGHTADDQAETVLLRLLRGTSPLGLSGIPAVRPPFIRPLITTHRASIVDYLHSAHLAWVEDSSNARRTYPRNRIRLDLLPTLARYNPQVKQRLTTLAEMLHADNDLLEQQTEALKQRVVKWRSSQRLSIQGAAYKAAPLALQRRLLRSLMDQLLSPPSSANFRHIETLRQFILAGAVGKRLGLPGGLMVERQQDAVMLWRTGSALRPTHARPFPVPGEVLLPELHFRVMAQVMPAAKFSELTTPSRAYVALEQTHLPLSIRFPQAGDRFYPLGAPGSKKLQDFFVDSKVPRAERAWVPLVMSGTAIVWVVGHRIAEPFRVRPGMPYIVQLCCEAIEPPSTNGA